MSTYKPARINKPWGYELVWAHTQHYAGKILHIDAGESLSLQYHEHKDETIMVLSGRIEFVHYGIDTEPVTLELAPHSPFHIPPGLRHRMTALEDTELIEVSTPQLDDVVRLEDRYGRVGTSTP